MLYQFIGNTERTYPQIVIDGSVLVAQPGQVCKFNEPPGDGLWVEIAPPKEVKPAKAASKES